MTINKMSDVLLTLKHLKVSYFDRVSSSVTTAVDDVSLSLEAGERLGLVGESGCGKSTLGRAIMRLLPNAIVEGELNFQGESILSMTPQQLRRCRGEAVSLVFQDPMTRLNPLMTIGTHCVETLRAHRPQLSDQEAKKSAIEVLETVKIPASRWSQYPHEFSGGMRQRVAIALALLLEPKLIIADEPTTSLDVTVSAEILQELTRLCLEKNVGLLLISHDLALVGTYCDRVAVMYQGKLVELGKAKQVLSEPKHNYTQSLLKAALLLHLPQKKRENATTEKPILEVKNLVQHYTLEQNLIQQLLKKEPTVIKAVDDVSFNLFAGEIFGLVGESGCGKSTLSRSILQLVRPTSGNVIFSGENLSQLSEAQVRQFRRQIQMIFQDPLACLNPLMKVGNSIADPLFIHQLATGKEAKEKAKYLLEKVGLTPVEEYYDRYPKDLSGGQQQRVSIARSLITNPQLIICDEPVSMLDATVQTQVLELMLSLKKEFNLTYLFITHDLSVARFLCDRIAVMNQGKIVELKATETLFNSPEHPYTKTLLNAAPSF
ncbi:ATPase component of various ABC-type transport systems with duplicated ATPase domain [Dactylococcopsis salina PCC 8305]|uniref:ATPase component of various ABC-type transport systems with duplicated ATPase domain n=2 Tax=Dactylococcopsis salina TaxID=292566 RepID=K9YTP2_DACS8|nr:ATPase component of various ABC-type transport systems with duplicated ATPase domain [Dactylococcopsis salina PCC 8305]